METSETETKNIFILYKPKDIISGDFYHAITRKSVENRNELFYLLTADCTGHGVPGALMSIMGIAHLNESVNDHELIHPNDILDNMRNGIIASLNPEGKAEQTRDGMDCVLCAYDFKNMTLEFAAANNPLWLAREGTITEFKPDKMPVGMHHSSTPTPFSLQKISLRKGDLIYTFSDGFADQFGGKNGKKYKYQQLLQKLTSICQLPLAIQKDMLDKEFETWKGDLEQVDDVLIIGIKI